MTRKKADSGVTVALQAYLEGLPLHGAQRPLASVALLLAESLEAAPEYARARLAKELRELIGQFVELEAQAALEMEREERREQRRRMATWARDA